MDFMLGDLIHIRGKITTFRQIRQITANFAGKKKIFFFFDLWNFKLTAFFLLVIGIYEMTSSVIVCESTSVVTEIFFFFFFSSCHVKSQREKIIYEHDFGSQVIILVL